MSLSLKVSELLGLFPNANIDGALDLENISNFASSYIKQSNSLDTLVQEELEDIATLMS